MHQPGCNERRDDKPRQPAKRMGKSEKGMHFDPQCVGENERQRRCQPGEDGHPQAGVTHGKRARPIAQINKRGAAHESDHGGCDDIGRFRLSRLGASDLRGFEIFVVEQHAHEQPVSDRCAEA